MVLRLRRQFIGGDVAIDIVVFLETALYDQIIDIVFGNLLDRQEESLDAAFQSFTGEGLQAVFLQAADWLALEQGIHHVHGLRGQLANVLVYANSLLALDDAVAAIGSRILPGDR